MLAILILLNGKLDTREQNVYCQYLKLDSILSTYSVRDNLRERMFEFSGTGVRGLKLIEKMLFARDRYR